MAGKGIGFPDSFRAVLVAAPEGLAAAVGVAVIGRGTETLLTFVVAGEKDLEENGDQEEEAGKIISLIGLVYMKGWDVVMVMGYSHSDNCHCENDLLQYAGHTETQATGKGVIVGVALAQWCVDCAGTLVGAIAGHDGDGDHRTHEAHVQGNAQEGEEGHTAQAAGKDDA